MAACKCKVHPCVNARMTLSQNSSLDRNFGSMEQLNSYIIIIRVVYCSISVNYDNDMDKCESLLCLVKTESTLSCQDRVYFVLSRHSRFHSSKMHTVYFQDNFPATLVYLFLVY